MSIVQRLDDYSDQHKYIFVCDNSYIEIALLTYLHS